MSRNGSGLSDPGLSRAELATAERAHVLEAFGADGSVTDVAGILGDGKEATVYACTTAPHTGVERAVAKVYRAEHFRAFRSARGYVEGEVVKSGRAARALANRSAFGRALAHQRWVAREWETLCRLFDAGVDVPEPYAHSSDAILMEWIGDADGIAPKLQDAQLDAAAAHAAGAALLAAIEGMLRCDVIHGDLSPYNALWFDGRSVLIDFPQAADARTHPRARALLERDVRNVLQWQARRGGPAPRPEAVAGSLWERWRRGRLT